VWRPIPECGQTSMDVYRKPVSIGLNDCSETTKSGERSAAFTQGGQQLAALVRGREAQRPEVLDDLVLKRPQRLGIEAVAGGSPLHRPLHEPRFL